VVAAQGPHPQVELQDDFVARIPGAVELQIAPRGHLFDGRAVDGDFGLAGPLRDPHQQRQTRRLRGPHLHFHGPVARVVGGLDERPDRTVRQLDLGFSRSVVVQVQAVVPAKHRPLTDQAQAVGAVDAAAVQFGRAGPRLEHDAVGGRQPLPIHRRIVGTPPAAGMFVPQRRVPRRVFQRVGDPAVAGQPQRLDAQFHPRHGATGLDRARLERVADRLFAGAEAARVVYVGAVDAPPPMDQRLPIAVVARDAEQFGQTDHRVQAFPTRLGGLVELNAAQRHPLVVARGRLLPVLLDFAHQPQVVVLLGLAVQQAEGMDHGHVHLVRAGVMHPLAGVQEGRAHQVRRAARSLQRFGISRVLMPQDHGQHAVVMSPQVPSRQQMIVGKRTEVAVFGLGPDQFAHDPRGHLAQCRIIRQAAGQHTRCQVLADEFACPRDRVFVGRLAVAQSHHFEHSRIRIRSRDQPVADDAVHARRHRPIQGHLDSRHRQVDRRLARDRLPGSPEARRQGQQPRGDCENGGPVHEKRSFS